MNFTDFYWTNRRRNDIDSIGWSDTSTYMRIMISQDGAAHCAFITTSVISTVQCVHGIARLGGGFLFLSALLLNVLTMDLNADRVKALVQSTRS